MGSRAISIAKRFSGTVADAEWLRDCLIKAFEEGVEWEEARQRKERAAKAEKKRRRLERMAKAWANGTKFP